MQKLRILILYPEPQGLALLTSMLKSLGCIIEEASNDRMAVKLMERDQIDLVLAGVDPGDTDALELLTYVRRKHREVPVVLLFPRLHPERAKEALRLGAMAVLKYPVPAAELRAAVLQALERCETKAVEGAPAGPVVPATAAAPSASASSSMSPMHNGQAAPGHDHHHDHDQDTAPIGGHRMSGGPDAAPAASTAANVRPVPASGADQRRDLLARDLGLIGNDPSWRQVIELAATIAPTRSPVLIAGEPGTGKAQLARLIHAMGLGTDRPFIACDAAAMADDLSPDDEEEEDRPEGPPSLPADSSLLWAGRRNLARGGSLFIDDVADLPMALQLHLLRDLQAPVYGSSGDVRFVLATGESLPSLIEHGRFRQELYHRIGVVVLSPPPLRHRGTDIELLAESFRERYAQEFRKNVVGFSRDALDLLQRHDWPGNVRELEAAIQRAVALCNGARISSNQLAPILNHHRQARAAGLAGTPKPHVPMGLRSLKEALEEPEKRIIIQALQAFNWNRQETARVLDINRTTLYKKMKKYGLLIDEPMWAQ